MKTTKRFDKAVTKLYTAFHEGTLNAFRCQACAVGNIVGHGNWFGFSGCGLEDGKFNKNTSNHFEYPNDSYYSPKELREIEYLFLNAWNGDCKLNGYDKERQFKGLSAVVEYLCELDRIPNVMDYTCLFEVEDNKPKYELQFN